ncbi:MAG: YqhA family protein [Bauldia sp.]|nr:YqhA family protein [Bauldia sp.]
MSEPTPKPAKPSFADERDLSADDLRRGEGVLRAIFALRLVMLVGSVGSFLGSLLMFYQGFLYVIDAFNTLSHGTGDGHVAQVTVPVLEAVDSFLFGVVLVIFAYGIAVGFVFRLPPALVRILPSWMRISGVGQLKAILAEVVVVVLIVIFARVVVEAVDHGGGFDWSLLVLPVAIVLVAGAIRLLELSSHSPDENGTTPSKPDAH